MAHSDSLTTTSSCPLPVVSGAPVEMLVPVESAVWMVADNSTAELVAEEFLTHGHQHGHGDGQLMTMPAAVGTELQFEDELPITLWVDGRDRTVAFTVELAPWLDDDDTQGVTLAETLPETSQVGWSVVTVVPMVGEHAVMGDPAGVETGDTSGVVLVQWPEPGGCVQVSVYAHGGHRRVLRGVWVAQDR